MPRKKKESLGLSANELAQPKLCLQGLQFSLVELANGREGIGRILV